MDIIMYNSAYFPNSRSFSSSIPNDKIIQYHPSFFGAQTMIQNISEQQDKIDWVAPLPFLI